MKIERLEPEQYAGRTSYSGSLSCEGVLVFKNSRLGAFVFEETIERGKDCEPRGRIEVSVHSSDEMAWSWYDLGAADAARARAVLSRSR